MKGIRGKGRALYFVFPAALLISLMVAAAAAVAIECTNEYVREGDTIRVSYRGLPDGTHLSVLIEGDLAPEGGNYVMEATGFFLPASLLNGSIIAAAENAASAEISIRKGSSTISASEESSSGRIRILEHRDVAAGIYEEMRIGGSALDRNAGVQARIQLTGEKSGPVDAEIAFVMRRISAGAVRIVVYVDGAEMLNRLMPVQGVSTGAGQGAGASGAYSEVTAPPGETVENITAATSSNGTAIESLDGVLSLRGAVPADIRILEVKPTGIPPAWRLITPAYAISPEGIELGEPMEILIRLPGGVKEGNVLFIARLSDRDWQIVPSRIEGDRISARVERTGIYALMGMADLLHDEGGAIEEGPTPSHEQAGSSVPEAPAMNLQPYILFSSAICVILLFTIWLAWRSRQKGA